MKLKGRLLDKDEKQRRLIYRYCCLFCEVDSEMDDDVFADPLCTRARSSLEDVSSLKASRE